MFSEKIGLVSKSGNSTGTDGTIDKSSHKPKGIFGGGAGVLVGQHWKYTDIIGQQGGGQQLQLHPQNPPVPWQYGG